MYIGIGTVELIIVLYLVSLDTVGAKNKRSLCRLLGLISTQARFCQINGVV